MKKILMIIAATSAIWASVVFGLDYYNGVYILFSTTMESLVDQYASIYNAAHKLHQAYLQCRNATLMNKEPQKKRKASSP